MQAEMTDASTETIDCREDDGTLRDVLRSNNRKLIWEDICSELIDNALEHSRVVCNITISWDKHQGGTFRAVDDGDGSSDMQAFFKPGKSVATGRSQGNSTFGMGLFVCECCLSTAKKPGLLRVATTMDGAKVLVGVRSIDVTSKVSVISVDLDDEARLAYGLQSRGTSVTFSRFAKTLPSSADFNRIAAKLGKAYGFAIASGQLSLALSRNGTQQQVIAETTPQCEDLKTACLDIEGHQFHVEWGVTKDTCRDNGCRMIYGGKFFETSAEPCGEFMIGRFYASIRVPRTIGKDSMDILKRTISHSSIDELFDACSELFRPELEASDALCRQADDAELNKEIEAILSLAVKTPTSDDPPKDDSDETGTVDARNYKGRDPDGIGVVPVRTGRIRRGRKKGSRRELPKDIKVFWSNLGADKGIVIYEHEARRVTYNVDVPVIEELRHSKNKLLIGSIAAGQIARDLEGTERQRDFGFGDHSFAWIYRIMMERVLQMLPADAHGKPG